MNKLILGRSCNVAARPRVSSLFTAQGTNVLRYNYGTVSNRQKVPTALQRLLGAITGSRETEHFPSTTAPIFPDWIDAEEGISQEQILARRAKTWLAILKAQLVFWRFGAKNPGSDIDNLNNYLGDIFCAFDAAVIAHYKSGSPLPNSQIATPAAVHRWHALISQNRGLHSLENKNKVESQPNLLLSEIQLIAGSSGSHNGTKFVRLTARIRCGAGALLDAKKCKKEKYTCFCSKNLRRLMQTNSTSYLSYSDFDVYHLYHPRTIINLVCAMMQKLRPPRYRVVWVHPASKADY